MQLKEIEKLAASVMEKAVDANGKMQELPYTFLGKSSFLSQL